MQLTSVGVVEGGEQVLEDVTWALPAGEHAVVLGPNGSGKTTIVRLLTLRRHATTGDVEILGMRVGKQDATSVRKRVGVVGPSHGPLISRHIPVRLLVAGACRGITAPRVEDVDLEHLKRADEALAQVQMRELGHRAGSTLSTGEWQRVLLARALVSKPELLVLDEPCNGLDFVQRDLFLSTLDGLIDSPVAPSMVMITHHVEEVPGGVQHALLLRRGRAVASGDVAAVLTSEHLSEAYDTRLQVVEDGPRRRVTTAAEAR